MWCVSLIADCGLRIADWRTCIVNPQSAFANPQLLQISQAHRSPLLSDSQQAGQTFRRRDRIARGAMAAFDVDPEVIADGVEIAPLQVGQQLAREPHRADAGTLKQQPRQCAAVNRGYLNVVDLTVSAAIEGDPRLV